MSGIYVHWPFCQARCPYCDFNAHVPNGAIDQHAFRAALLAELDHAARSFDHQKVESVFFGGGTPSLMPPETVAALLARIDKLWGLGGAAEISLEANPNTADAGRFRRFADAGVNRISIGVQSLRDGALRALGRTHTAAQARAAIRAAADSVPRVSFDLITARPGQTAAAWRKEFAEALAIGVAHLSVYHLTIEEGTPFAALHARGKLTLPVDDTAVEVFTDTVRLAEAAGLCAYEISNFARVGEECRHNLNYWHGGDWLGIGPGAHGRPRRNGVRLATETLRNPTAWLRAIAAQGNGLARAAEPLDGEAEALEYLITALRLATGASPAHYRALGGKPLPQAVVRDLIGAGLLRAAHDHITTTPAGRLVLDAVLRQLTGNAPGTRPPSCSGRRISP